MWSRDYECCRRCGTDEIKYMARGLCKRCYLSDYRKNNKKKIASQKRAWHFRFHADNLLKRKATREEANFDGLRERVLKRDKYRCCRCGCRRNLIVHHKDRSGRGAEKHNNKLKNLETVCRACHVNEHRTELEAARKKKRKPQLLSSGKWSSKHPCCVICGTIKSRHAAKGLCQACYLRRYREKMT